MANPTAPFGLRPVRSLTGLNAAQVNEYAHNSDDSTAIFIGDPVVTTGTATSGNAGINDGTPFVIASGTATTTPLLRGAVTGVRPTLSNLTLQYGLASVVYALLVCDDPFALFDVMVTGTEAVADISGNIGITAASGSTYTGQSAYAATESSLGSTNVLRIIRLAPIVNNVVGASAVIEVMINGHELKSTSGT